MATSTADGEAFEFKSCVYDSSTVGEKLISVPFGEVYGKLLENILLNRLSGEYRIVYEDTHLNVDEVPEDEVEDVLEQFQTLLEKIESVSVIARLDDGSMYLNGDDEITDGALEVDDWKLYGKFISEANVWEKYLED